MCVCLCVCACVCLYFSYFPNCMWCMYDRCRLATMHLLTFSQSGGAAGTSTAGTTIVVGGWLAGLAEVKEGTASATP